MNTQSNNYPPFRVSQILERLPRPARKKFAQLQALVDDSEALVRSALTREKDLDSTIASLSMRLESIDQRGDPQAYQDLVEELKEGQTELAALFTAREKRNGVRRNCEQVLAQIRDVFLPNINPLKVHAVEIAAPTLQEGEDLASAILRLRREIYGINNQLQLLKTTHLPASEIKAALVAQVDAMVQAGCPRVDIGNGAVSIAWPDVSMFAAPGTVLTAPNGSASKLLAWMFRDQLIEKLTQSVDNIEDGIPQKEREPIRLRLEAELLQLERQEEHFVEQAIAAGLECERDPYRSGWAILGLAKTPNDAPATRRTMADLYAAE